MLGWVLAIALLVTIVVLLRSYWRGEERVSVARYSEIGRAHV